MDAIHRNIFEQLMKSENPERMFKEFREGGAKIISEYLLNISDEYILSRLKDINGLHILNPNLSENEMGITGMKIEIEKAKQIKSVIEDKKIKEIAPGKTLPPQPPETATEQQAGEITQTKKIISDQLETMDINLGWKYAFRTETDYKTFLNLLTCYFEYTPYTIPKTIIKLKRDCKTRFAKVLRPIHKEISNENIKLKNDKDFFKILRVLNHFRNSTDTEIYQAITR